MKNTIAQELAIRIMARSNCIENGNQSWLNKHEAVIELLIKQLPSGSGIDYGTSVNYSKSKTDKIVLDSAYHVMNDDGYYTGIIDYRVVVTPSLQFGFNVNVIGNFSSNRDAYGLKEYLFDIYLDALNEIVESTNI